MTRPTLGLCAVFLVFTAIAIAGIPVAAADTVDANPLLPQLQSFYIDDFTYRASFRLPGGIEGLLIRSSLAVTYLYQHHNPTVNNLYMSVKVAFYYGKTILGRAVVQDIRTSSVAFYPKWHDGSGHLHDMYMVDPLFVLNGSIDDGQTVGDTLLMDPDALTRYVIDFGGTLVIDGLVFMLGDGQEVVLTQGKAEIALEKYYNDFDPRAASLYTTDNLTSAADSKMLAIVASGEAIVPFVVIVDTVIAFSLVGMTLLMILLIVLHLSGRRRLLLGRLGRLVHRSTPIVH